MDVYRAMYLTLFHAATDAVQEIRQRNYGLAEQILIRAQQKAEEQYLEQEEKNF